MRVRKKRRVSARISSISVFIPLLSNGERYQGRCIATTSLPFSISLLLYFIHFSFSFSDRLRDPFDCFIHLDLWVQTTVTVNIGKIGNAQQWHPSPSLFLFFFPLSFCFSPSPRIIIVLECWDCLMVSPFMRELNSASAFRGVNLAVSRSVCSDVCVGDNG